MIVHAEKEELERQYQTEGVRKGVSSCIAIGTGGGGGGGLRQFFPPLPIWGACAVKILPPHFILTHTLFFPILPEPLLQYLWESFHSTILLSVKWCRAGGYFSASRDKTNTS